MVYTDQGQGKTVLFIHGFCENKSIWDNFVFILKSDYRVISIDLPGFGESKWEAEISLEYYAKEVLLVLDELNINQVTLIGHSLGGYVALAFAELFESRLSGIVLFHSTAFADTEEKKQNRNKTIEFIKRNGLPSFADNFVEPLFFHGNRAKLKVEILTVRTMVLNTSVETVIETIKVLRGRKERIHVLKQIKKPVMFIVGKEDGAIPLEKSLQQCSLPTMSTTYFLENCGHMGMYEKKEETLAIIASFLELANR